MDMKSDPAAGLNWNLLRMYHVIAAERSITGAAKVLGMSQPSVSNGLRKLEAQLGGRLVHRDSRRFELTPLGVRILAECRHVFAAGQRISAIVQEAHDDAEGLVRYQIISNLASPMLDEIMRLYHQRRPAVSFQSEIRNSQAILANIRQGQLNIGICLLAQPDEDLCAIRLFREEFRLFCGAEHPLFGKQAVSVDDLRDEPFISFACASEGHGLEPMSMLRDGARLGSRIAGMSTNMEEVRRMIVAGLGVGVLPLMSAMGDIRDGALWPLKIMEEPIGADVYLVHAAPQDLTPAEHQFVQTVHELIAIYPDMV